MTLRVIAATVLFAATVNLVSMPGAHAGRLIQRDHGYDGIEEGHVVARSRHNNGSVSGAVRMTDLGPQVRLPGGTWEYCRRSCSETLRVETVDRWEGPLSGNGLTQECGLFGCLSLGFGW